MNAAEIVKRKMQRNSSLQIVEFLREGIRQTCKTSDCHPESEVASLDVTSRDVARIGPSVAYLYYRFDHRRRRVPTSRIMLAVIAVYFYHLREVGLSREDIFYAFFVKMESVSRDLKTVLWCDSITERGQKLISAFAVTFANRVRGNEFCFSINRNKNPSISEFHGVTEFYVALLLAAKTPQLIRLNSLAAKILHARFHQLYAAFSSTNQRAHDRVPMQARNALRAPNAGALNQQLNRQKCFIFRHCHCAEQARMFFRVRPAALRAAESLETIAVLPELPAFAVALEAFHV
jgi:hypothetical protein